MQKNNQTGHILPKWGADKKVNNFLWRTVQMCRYFLTTSTNMLLEDKNIKQMRCYTQEIGRSMVEMLGVLAIIGVLSVGAIAGYSKAMMKYKLNKHAQSFNLLLNSAINLRPQLERTHASFDGELFAKLNLLPNGMTYKNSYIYDIFNNQISYYIGYHNSGRSYESYFSINLSSDGNKITNDKFDVCHNILNVAKDNSANLHYIEVRTRIGESYSTYVLYGNDFCSNNRKCLANMSLDDIDKMCRTCESEISCVLMVYLSAKSFY